VERGYRVVTLSGLWHERGSTEVAGRRLILRHDIDTDPLGAAAMWSIEQRLGLTSSYFFRLSTVDVGLMREMAAAGQEVSYHYEELATVAKRLRLGTRAEAVAILAEARSLFAQNLTRLRERTGLPMRVVAAHGDWMNRRLGMSNALLLDDAALRATLGIELEAYDAAFLALVPVRSTDGPAPHLWSPADPAVALAGHEPVVQVLVHPRHWVPARMANLRDDVRRLGEAVAFARVRPGTATPPSVTATSPGRPSVTMALYGDLTYDSRVRKEARSLAEAGYRVTVACLADRGERVDLPVGVEVRVVRPVAGTTVLPGVANPFVGRDGVGRVAAAITRTTWFFGYARAVRHWGRAVVSAAGPTDIWHAHDLTGLAAIVPALPRGTPVVYDSHELFLEAGTASRLPGLARRSLRAYERRLVSRTTAVITVNPEIEAVLQRRYRPRRTAVVANCPEPPFPPPTRGQLIGDAIGLPAEAPIVLYHGGLSTGRGLDQLLEAFEDPRLTEVHLVFMGAGELGDDLRRRAAEPRWAGRLHVLEPRPPAELLPWVGSADAGAIPNPGATLNDVYSSPNKLFECLAAGTPVVATDLPAVRRVLLADPDQPLGAVARRGDATAFADALSAVLAGDPAERRRLRERCARAAAGRWNWPVEAQTLVGVYADIAAP